MRYCIAILSAFFLFVLFESCRKEGDRTLHQATPYQIEYPPFFPQMDIPSDNPLTEEGIELGRWLFYEKKLSGNNSMSCASCHAPAFAFSDHNNRFSLGIDGIAGDRNSMAIVNLGWGKGFFWDHRSPSLEVQILEPVPNPIEMHESWPDAINKLEADEKYPSMFFAAFGTQQIDRFKVAKAIAQFMRIMISGRSKFDLFRLGQYQLTPEEALGFDTFQKEGGDPMDGNGGQWGADCFHCHGLGDMLFTDNQLHNNGLDSVFTDLGAGGITGNPADMGRFKTPTLRNIELTAPYMHDGRFETLEEVIEHYNSGGHPSPTIDPFMKYTSGGLQLSQAKKDALVAFLKTLTDTSFINNPAFQDPDPTD